MSEFESRAEGEDRTTASTEPDGRGSSEPPKPPEELEPAPEANPPSAGPSEAPIAAPQRPPMGGHGYGPPPGGYGAPPGGYGPPPGGYGAPPPGAPPPFQRPPGWVEPDPFKNARGLSGMFNKREGTMPLWPFMIAAVGIIGVIFLRLQLASQAKAARDAEFQNMFDQSRRNQAWNDPSRYGNGGPGYGGPSYGGPSYGGPSNGGGTGPSQADLEVKARKLCTKLINCQGADATMMTDLVDSCIRQELAGANDPQMRQMTSEVLDGIDRECGAKSCDQYTNCMFDHLGAQGADLAGPAQPVTASDREQIRKLTCELAMQGPDGAASSPKGLELQALLTKIGPAAAAKIMKEVVNECEPPGGGKGMDPGF